MRIKHLLLGVLAVAAAVACKPDEIEVTPALEVNKTSASVVAEGGDVTVEVTSNVEWTASADQDWVSINPASGKGSDKAVSVKITVDPNETEASRTAVVTVAADKLTKKVNITQAAKAGETPGPDGPKFEVTELYILGGATDNGWSLDTMEAFEKADDVWVWEGNLKPGEQFRFPLQKVSGQWWPCLVPTADGTAVVYAEDEIANEYSVAEDGKHKVTVNPVDGSLKVERIGDRETVKVTVTELYMLGSACDTGWSLDDMTAFTNNDGIFTWTGNLKAGEEFRFPLQKVSGQWWPCLMISADGTSIVYGTSDDEKVIYTVSETGNYTITIDARDFDNMTFEIVYNGPATEAPADVDIDGKQWVFVWEEMYGVTALLDLGVTEPGAFYIAFDQSIFGESGWALLYSGTYTIEKGVLKITIIDPTVGELSADVPYTTPSDNEAIFDTSALEAALNTKSISAVASPEFIDIMGGGQEPEPELLADGDYWIVSSGKVATPLSSAGNLQTVDAVGGKSTASNAFNFRMIDEYDWLYVIKDSNGMYLYLDATGNFAASETVDYNDDSYCWQIYPMGDGTYYVANFHTMGTVQLNSDNAYVCLEDMVGSYPELIPAIDPIPEQGGDEPVTPEMPEIPADYTAATLWEGSLEMAWGTGMQALAYGGYNWANCEVGQYLKVSVTPTDPSAEWTVQLLYADEEYAWAGIDFLPDFKNVEEIVVELTEELLALFAAPNNGLIIQGDNATATKVELYRKPAGAAGYALTMTNGTEGENWSTQVWYTLDEPLKAGAQYEFKCVAKSTVARDWCSIFLQSADGNDQNYAHGMNLSTEWTPTTLTINPDKDTYTKLTFNIGDFIGTVSLDNVSLKEVGSDVELIKNGDFENGTTAGWGSWTGAEGIGEGYAGN